MSLDPETENLIDTVLHEGSLRKQRVERLLSQISTNVDLEEKLNQQIEEAQRELHCHPRFYYLKEDYPILAEAQQVSIEGGECLNCHDSILYNEDSEAYEYWASTGFCQECKPE